MSDVYVAMHNHESAYAGLSNCKGEPWFKKELARFYADNAGNEIRLVNKDEFLKLFNCYLEKYQKRTIATADLFEATK